MEKIKIKFFQRQESISFVIATATFTITTCLIWLILSRTLQSQVHFNDLLSLVMPLSSIVGFATVAVAYILKRRTTYSIDTKHWALFLTIFGFALAYFLGEASVIFLDILSNSFRGMTIDPISTTFFVAFTMGLISYITAIEVFNFNLKKLSLFMLSFSLTGFLVTAAYHWDPRWWANSMCSLGMGVGSSGIFYIYNTTLVITSLLLGLTCFYLSPILDRFAETKKISPTSIAILKAAYIFIITQIFIVGLIPYGHNEILSQIHVFSGNIIFVVIGAIMLMMGLLIPRMKKTFYITNYLILTVGVYFYILYNYIHYFSITFYEINSIFLIIIWFLFVIENLKSLSK